MPGVVLFVDFPPINAARRFSTWLDRDERARLSAGQLVTLVGDSVGPLPARIVSVGADDPSVEFELPAAD